MTVLGTFTILLAIALSGYATPQPQQSPLPTPEPFYQGIAGIGNCWQLDDIGANAWYSWRPADGRGCEGFIPMVRDADQWEQLHSGQVIITPTLLLGFNEPDLASQANLTPQEAVPLERWRLTHYTQTVHVSPAPSQNDVNWLRDMRYFYIQEYDEPPAWDYLAAHCYFYDSSSLYRCKTILNKFIGWSHSWGAQGVLVTEFGSFAITYHPSDPFDWDGAVSRGQDFIAWMEGKPEIGGYWWYSVNDWGAWDWYLTTALYEDDGATLTPLGVMYKDVLTESDN
jgi:hypothetical protein